eukprot:ANDGO_00901.mRNA.1 ADP-ribosylation factor GTPase-activating protein AGD2
MLRKLTIGTERMLQKMGRQHGSETPEAFEDANAKFKALCSHYEQVAKVAKNFTLCSADYSDAGYKWAEAMLEYGRTSSTELGVCLVKFGNKLESIMELQSGLESAVTDEVLKASTRFLKEDAPNAAHSKSTYKQNKYEYDRVHASLEKTRAKHGASDPKVQLEERRVEGTKNALGLALDDALKNLNHAWEKGDYEYLKSVLAVMKAFDKYFTQGTDIIQSIRPYMAQLEEAVQHAESSRSTGVAAAATGSPAALATVDGTEPSGGSALVKESPEASPTHAPHSSPNPLVLGSANGPSQTGHGPISENLYSTTPQTADV